MAADSTSAAYLLRDAAQAAVSDPKAAFLLFNPGRPALKYWGPNFFTKYLYFAGGGDLRHPSLIVDARVLATLYRTTGNTAFRPRSTSYSATSYLAACEVMQKWADELSSPERQVGADEVERWAFNAGRGWRQRTEPTEPLS
ncbi:8-oxoguanine DNA glycosylase OGG fold protein [Paenarthrobacter nicotinovorans]|uniref:8-oxoguanine DNA glycosylase OGG fold protein n=1 Tax=Paenarthrobacter nicotinovorans TaxID=29320 RepID=UPI0038996D13